MTRTDAAAFAPGSSPGRGHLIALDGLRGLAIVMVLAHHFISMRNTSGGIAHVVGALTASLWCGVDLFFVLSGFLVTRVLLNSAPGPGYLRRFFTRRILRVFPLYYLVILTALVLTLLGKVPGELGLPIQPRTYVPLLFYARNFYMPIRGQSPFGSLFIFWSLAVEEHFYFIWPFVIILVQRRTKLLWACGLLASAIFGCRLILLQLRVSSLAIYIMTICRADTLVIGAAICLLMQPGANAAIAYRWGYAACAVAALLLGTVSWSSGYLGLREFQPVVQKFGFTLLAIFMGGLLTICITGPSDDPFVWLCRSKILRWFGKYSYGIYVFHTMILDWVIAHLTVSQNAGKLAFAAFGLLRPLVGVSISVAAALCSYHLLEKHMLRLKDRLSPVREI